MSEILGKNVTRIHGLEDARSVFTSSVLASGDIGFLRWTKASSPEGGECDYAVFSLSYDVDDDSKDSGLSSTTREIAITYAAITGEDGKHAEAGLISYLTDQIGDLLENEIHADRRLSDLERYSLVYAGQAAPSFADKLEEACGQPHLAYRASLAPGGAHLG